jgi:hypothetical protein
MNYLTLLKSLYAANGMVAVLLYRPQILKAWRSREEGRSISLMSFGGWSAGSAITTLYAWFFVQDRIFAAVSLGNLVGSGAVFALAAVSRLSRRQDGPSPPFFRSARRHKNHLP